MREIMTKLRKKPVGVVGDLAVQSTEDYLSRRRTAADGTVSDIELPVADAVKLILEKSSWICIRPSGTEPKIKIYYAARESTRKAAESQLKNISSSFEQKI
jgi:phosphoglucomutase